jgi:membrane associated rhomboid family serine protease/tetratricopeptide (TPR) repeat protein
MTSAPPKWAPEPPRTSWVMWLGFEPTPLRQIVKSPLTLLLLLINVALFMVELELGNTFDEDSLVRFGATLRSAVWDGGYWRLATSSFLHLGVAHLAANMLALPGWGARVETTLGTAKMALVYVSAAIGSSAVSLLAQNMVAGGASGAIFGLIGVVLVFEYRAAGGVRAFVRRRGVPRRLLVIAATFAVLPFARSMNFEIDHGAHLGGLVVGIVFGALLTSTRGPARGRWTLAVSGLLLVCVAACVPFTTAHGRWQRRMTRALAHNEYREIIRLAKTAPADVPAEWPALVRGFAHLELNEPAEAIAAIGQADQPAPVPGLPRWKAAAWRMDRGTSLSAESLRIRGEAHYRLDQFDRAIADLDASIAKDATDARSFYIRGLVHEQRKSPKLAEADLTRALSLLPDFEKHIARARVRMQNAALDGAMADVEKARALAPSCPDCDALHGAILVQRQQDADAISWLDKALKKEPGNWLALRNRCVALAGARSPDDEIVSACSRAIEAEPKYAHSYVLRAGVRVRRDEYAAALADYDAALKLEPASTTARKARAWCRLLANDAAGALEDAEAFVRSAPDEPAALVIRAEAKHAAGDAQGALADFTKALSLAPEDWNYRERATAMVRQLQAVGRK